ncbi:mediator of RNA polymerase II transcription subunit 25-like [Silene latifolia]|uniref:mediator of RNA polymerase II transcription subunit 25-like n=1 Tax=Silene latifolia TaxID=37657 RepID=UPI003D771E25
MADKQLIIVVEGTGAMGPYWNTIVSDYLQKIIRSFCANDSTVQKSSPSAASGSTFELALVVFNTQGPYSAYVVQRSGWTRDVDHFFDWLSALSFSGGGWNDVATAEGLSEALMMFAIPQNGFQTQQDIDGKRHCVLVSASNPYPLPTPVYRPTLENLEMAENGEEKKTLLYDAETVSKWFGQCSVSLSVICPRQLPKLRAIYNAAKRSEKESEPAVDVKQPHFLVLISNGFIEACAALSRPVVPPTNGSTLNKPPISSVNAPTATIKVEPCTVTSIGSEPAHTHMPSMARPTGPSASIQASSLPKSENIITNDESFPELKPMISLPQPVRTIGDIQNAVLSSRVPIAVHVSNIMSSGMTSSGQSSTITGTSQPIQNTAAINSISTVPSNVPTISNISVSHPPTNFQGSVNNTMRPTVSGTGQGNVQSMPQRGASENPNMTSSRGTNGGASVSGSKMPMPGFQQQAQGMQSVGMNGSASTMTMSQQGVNSLSSSTQSKYIKVWEGDLCAQRDGQRVLVTKMEGYRSGTAPETLAANWPPAMVLGRLISQDFMNSRQHAGKAVFLVFRAMNQHGFLLQLQEKKLCAVIQLPSQTLLLSVSDKACRLIGMLFPGDIVHSKPQIPSQVSQQNQQQLLQRQHLQQPQIPSQVIQQNQQQQQQPQRQHLQQQQQTMQMVSGGMSQGYMQASVRPQSVPQAQGQVPSQGTSPNMAGGGFNP